MGRVPVLAVLLLVIGAPLTVACTDQSGVSGPDMTSVGFESDGTGCTITDAESTFPVGVAIHTVLGLSPALPTGSTVTVRVERDGVELVEARQTITVAEPAPCIWGTLPELDVGHYRMTYEIRPSQMQPASGEFDVIQAQPTLGSAGAATDAPTPTRNASLATQIVGRLDALAALADQGDDLLTADWAIDESGWVTENMPDLLDQGGTLERYVDAEAALLDLVAAGADQGPAISRLLSLRDEIATEFALPTLGPTPSS